MRSLVLVFGLFLAQTVLAKPNVIVIYTDDHGWPDIGAAGVYDDLRTPNIDALAASGVRATNGYSTAPQCVPSRAGLLAGRAQNRFGVESNGESLEGFDAQETIAERLKKAGYATGQIGKWHLGPANAIPQHGFDDVYSKNANRPCWANFNLNGETIPMQQVDDGLYHLDACSEAAVTFIRRHADGPFFLYLAYRAPHVPLDAPKKYLDRFPGEMAERRRQALAMISAMDDGVGSILTELENRGLRDDTIIFFIGDNGAPLKIHKEDAPGGGPGWDGSLNEPMNGEKGMLAEGGIRVPYLVSWPTKFPAGQVFEHPVTALDVAATASAAAGIEIPEGELDGADLTPFLSGEKSGPPHEFLTWRWIAQSAVRSGRWKLLRGGQREYLFDLEADPGEKNDLLAANPEIAKGLRDKLEFWAEELDPPGLAAGKMSETWEKYFDFYLDGKPAPPLAKPDLKIAGWIGRNCEFATRDGALQVKSSGQKQRPFIVTSGFKIKQPFFVRVRVKSEVGGQAGVAWRCESQKDFPKEQVLLSEKIEEGEWSELSFRIQADSPVIHLRLLLPGGNSEIDSVRFEDENDQPLQVWSFAD